MAKSPSYILSYLREVPLMAKERLFHRSEVLSSFGKNKILSIEEGGDFIRNIILKPSSSPFLLMRFGASELGIVHGKEKIERGLASDFKKKAKWAISVRAGIHPTDKENLLTYAFLFEEALKEAEAIQVFGFHMERYFYEKFAYGKPLLNGFAAEPFLGKWSSALKGKKVLVLSPFKEEILSQYKKRDKLLPNEKELLPSMDLRVVSPPYTLGEGEFPPYYEGVNSTVEECLKEPFDIALISAGGYSALIGLELKRAGYSSFIVGGSLQTLFGIIGKRWINREHVSQRMNDAWIHPQKEKPKGFEQIDGGAYW